MRPHTRTGADHAETAAQETDDGYQAIGHIRVPKQTWIALNQAKTVADVLKCAYEELCHVADAEYGGTSKYHNLLKAKVAGAIKSMERADRTRVSVDPRTKTCGPPRSIRVKKR